MSDMERVIDAATQVSCDRIKAERWLAEPIEAFGGKTGLQLVSEGRADALIGYLESFASGFVG